MPSCCSRAAARRIFKRPVSGEPDRNSTQASRKAPKPIHSAIPCSCATLDSALARGAARSTFRDDLAHRAVHEPECRGGEVSQNRYSPSCRVDKLSRAFDLAERPKRDRQIDHGGNADILAEAKGEFAVPFGIESREGPFEVRASLDEISCDPLRHAIDPMRDARFRQMELLLHVAQKGPRWLAHRVQIAVHMGSRPEPVIDRKPRL